MTFIRKLVLSVTIMKTSLFDYHLPQELIAQEPLSKRDESRLLVIDRKKEEISHHKFTDLPEFLKQNDLLVMNNSRVLPARLFGTKAETGGKVEVLLICQKKNNNENLWEAMVNPGRRIHINNKIIFSPNLYAQVMERLTDGKRLLKFHCTGDFWKILNEIGQMPLPPYIHKHLNEGERYQTIYSKDLGSVAAPTAGLHFSEALFNKLDEKNIKRTFVTLHVGPGTFRPVKTDDINSHQMDPEFYYIYDETINLINECKANNNRILAVGTTSIRTIESAFQDPANITKSDWTRLFITPGYKFKVVDAILTNFHLPRSTLLMLISSFAGLELIKMAYNEAIKEKYRFYSFGDAMLIL